MTDTNIWGAFSGIGVSFHDIDDIQRVLFNEITLSESEGLQELSTKYDPPEYSWPRPWNTKFGWISKPE
jgi:hypothetical protein